MKSFASYLLMLHKLIILLIILQKGKIKQATDKNCNLYGQI